MCKQYLTTPISRHFLTRLSTIAAVVNKICAVTRSTSLCVALSASVQQRKALKTQPRCAYTHTTPTGNVLEIPALRISLAAILNNVAEKGSPKLRSISTVCVQLGVQKNVRCME